MMKIKGLYELSKLENKVKKILDQAIADRMLEAAIIVKNVLYEMTPVWSGDTLSNYQWSTEAPSSEYVPFNQDMYWFDESMLSNEAEALAITERNFSKINWKRVPYQKVFVSNNTQYTQNNDGMVYTFSDLEFGTLPQARFYGGIFERVALALRKRFK